MKYPIACLCLILASLSSPAQAISDNLKICGNLANSFGPYDLREGNIANRIGLVEGAHFPPHVENNVRGQTAKIGGDIDYTLRAIPNHVRALLAMMRQGEIEKAIIPQGAKYPVECYFDRAVRFAPDDAGVWGAYGQYLTLKNRHAEALAMFEKAYELKPEDAIVSYNLGLAYLKNKDFEKANLMAHKAYALGFPLPGLKNKLVEAGQWKDPAE